MSELDVDGEIVASSNVVESKGYHVESIYSCILSSKKGIEKLHQVLESTLSNHQPDLIIIETSGSSHPLPLVEFFHSQSNLKLTGMLTLADSLMLAHDFA